ncbi:MAG: hypothetical protein NZ922_04495 [Candidatus Methanomethyliaceae archaeon]|nr:hypothetical protein [Candidatus Methanomethyliaceae archaeon]MDW7971320.1 hypothetical protein [Nitrososphaerota archaeon]
MWLELLPNPTILNDPAYFSPRYFSQLFSIMTNQFRLFIERDKSGVVRFLMEVNDEIALSISEYISTLLKCSIHQCDPPMLNYKYRLEAMMAKHYRFPITKKWSEDQQWIFHPPIPADSIISSILALGTAVEIISKPKNNLSGVIDEKSLSRIFECNIYIYGNRKEWVRATLSSFPKTSKNWLVEYKIKKQEGWKFKGLSKHILASNKLLILKVLALALGLIFLKNFNIKSILMLSFSFDSLIILILPLIILLIKDYRAIALCDYELASIFSFPSPSIPVKKPIMAVVRNGR